MDLYVAGFPCKAFSRLRAKTKGLKDPQARQFFGVCRAIKDTAPKATWLGDSLNRDKCAVGWFAVAPCSLVMALCCLLNFRIDLTLRALMITKFSE